MRAACAYCLARPTASQRNTACGLEREHQDSLSGTVNRNCRCLGAEHQVAAAVWSQVYSAQQARSDIDAVYSMGLFDDVNILPQPAEDSTQEQPKACPLLLIHFMD